MISPKWVAEAVKSVCCFERVVVNAWECTSLNEDISLRAGCTTRGCCLALSEFR